jgi:hypothetical protein
MSRTSNLLLKSSSSFWMRVKDRLIIVHQVHLVDAEHHVRMPSSEAMKEWRQVCSRMPLRASTRMIARFAVLAPVTMLRVYWMCPGVSAMMNLRFGVAK